MQLLSVIGPTVSAKSGTFTLLLQCALRRTTAGGPSGSWVALPNYAYHNLNGIEYVEISLIEKILSILARHILSHDTLMDSILRMNTERFKRLIKKSRTSLLTYCRLRLFSSQIVSSKPPNEKPTPRPPGVENDPEWLRLVRQHVSALRFGVVQITVQNGHVVLIERTDRLRFDKPE